MVGGSDLAFRLLCRRHGAELAYTEMLFAERLCADRGYRERKLQSCAEDRPLVVQLCACDPAALGEAAALVAGMCDAVDINLGCPLPQAHQEGFGSSLLARDRWPTILKMVSAVRHCAISPATGRSLPVFCKIRLLDPPKETPTETLELCQMLERAGCALIAIHARPVFPPGVAHRAQRCEADLNVVRELASSLSIPVLSNGSTETEADVSRNLRLTGAAGVMSAEASLTPHFSHV